MEILKDYSLKPYNTFGIDVKADRMVRIRSQEQLKEVIASATPPFIILGEGSNILLTGDVSSLILKNEITGIATTEVDEDHAIISVGGGENWHKLVLWCIENEYGGIENLSLIPGTVGAAPLQNIGAYGVELKDVFVKLTAMDLQSGEPKEFTHAECKFGYRDSIFKSEVKGRYFVTNVVLRLTRKHHTIQTSYGDIQQQLEDSGISRPTIKDISNAVIAIRSSKLPDPKVLGNAGSFFKNPEIPGSEFEKLLVKFPGMVSYSLPDGKVKIPAAWLIEQCGWKGKRIGNTGSHGKQALVLVNYGSASGGEIFDLAMKIKSSVKEKFDIDLHPEVNII